MCQHLRTMCTSSAYNVHQFLRTMCTSSAYNANDNKSGPRCEQCSIELVRTYATSYLNCVISVQIVTKCRLFCTYATHSFVLKLTFSISHCPFQDVNVLRSALRFVSHCPIVTQLTAAKGWLANSQKVA